MRWRAGLLFAAAGIGPAALGGAVAGHLSAAVLTCAFSVVAGLAAVRMLRSGRTAAAVRVRPVRAAGAGVGLGAVTGVLGVGGGFLAVPALVGVLGLRMRQAVGTSLLVICVNSLAALATRAGPGDGMNWAVVGPFAGAAALGAWDGRRLASKVSGGTLQWIFALVLLAVAVFMLIDVIV